MKTEESEDDRLFKSYYNSRDKVEKFFKVEKAAQLLSYHNFSIAPENTKARNVRSYTSALIDELKDELNPMK